VAPPPVPIPDFDDASDVVSWIRAHPGLVGLVSTMSKIRMLELLFDDWWIDDDDVEMIGVICHTVMLHSESERLAAYINSRLLDMESIGQRTQVRLFRDSMP
jgi:hypothetical protein